MTVEQHPQAPYDAVAHMIETAIAAEVPATDENPAPLGDGLSGSASHTGSEGFDPSEKGQGDFETFCRKARWKRRLDWKCCNLALTDMGNAQRFVARYGRNFIFVDKWGWLAWDGKRWSLKDAAALLERAVQSTIKAISSEARLLDALGVCADAAPRVVEVEGGRFECLTREEGVEDQDSIPFKSPLRFNPLIEFHKTKGPIYKSDKISAWAIASQSNGHVSCVAKLAQPFLTANPDDFDVDDMAFNVRNGTLRFDKSIEGYVKLDRHRREDLITKLADVEYDPNATSRVYDAFLNRVQPLLDDQGSPRHVQQHLHVMAGLSLTGLQMQFFWFWYGLGGNGKSVLLDIWGHVVGEYSQAIPIESFLDQGRSRRGGEASPDIASLPGVRLLRTSEPARGAKIDEGLVKLVTGGEIMRARHLNRDFFEFRPKFKLNMLGNHRPRVDGTDEGFWRRVLLIPWQVIIPEAERDPLLIEKLRLESSGILNRMLDGLRQYLDKGLDPPDVVRVATADYRDDSDPIGQFLRDCTKPNPDANEAGGVFYKLYVAWAKANGEKPFSTKAFSRSLVEHGVRKVKSSGIYYCGIETTATIDSFKGMEWEYETKD
jgi:P4 family phage/plasmid primase-like protien